MTFNKNPEEPVKITLRLGSKLTDAEFLEKLQNAVETIKGLPSEEPIDADFNNSASVTLPLKQLLWTSPDKVAGEVGRPTGNRAQRRAAKRGRSR